MASHLRLFTKLAKKAIELGYSPELIEVTRERLTLWHSEDDEVWSDNLGDYISHADQTTAKISEFCTEALHISGDHYKTVIRVAANFSSMGDPMDPSSAQHY